MVGFSGSHDGQYLIAQVRQSAGVVNGQDLRPVRLEQHLFDDLADQVTGQDVALLNVRSFFRRNANGAIARFLIAPPDPPVSATE